MAQRTYTATIPFPSLFPSASSSIDPPSGHPVLPFTAACSQEHLTGEGCAAHATPPPLLLLQGKEDFCEGHPLWERNTTLPLESPIHASPSSYPFSPFAHLFRDAALPSPSLQADRGVPLPVSPHYGHERKKRRMSPKKKDSDPPSFVECTLVSPSPLPLTTSSSPSSPLSIVATVMYHDALRHRTLSRWRSALQHHRKQHLAQYSLADYTYQERQRRVYWAAWLWRLQDRQQAVVARRKADRFRQEWKVRVTWEAWRRRVRVRQQQEIGIGALQEMVIQTRLVWAWRCWYRWTMRRQLSTALAVSSIQCWRRQRWECWRWVLLLRRHGDEEVARGMRTKIWWWSHYHYIWLQGKERDALRETPGGGQGSAPGILPRPALPAGALRCVAMTDTIGMSSLKKETDSITRHPNTEHLERVVLSHYIWLYWWRRVQYRRFKRRLRLLEKLHTLQHWCETCFPRFRAWHQWERKTSTRRLAKLHHTQLLQRYLIVWKQWTWQFVQCRAQRHLKDARQRRALFCRWRSLATARQKEQEEAQQCTTFYEQRTRVLQCRKVWQRWVARYKKHWHHRGLDMVVPLARRRLLQQLAFRRLVETHCGRPLRPLPSPSPQAEDRSPEGWEGVEKISARAAQSLEVETEKATTQPRESTLCRMPSSLGVVVSGEDDREREGRCIPFPRAHTPPCQPSSSFPPLLLPPDEGSSFFGSQRVPPFSVSDAYLDSGSRLSQGMPSPAVAVPLSRRLAMNRSPSATFLSLSPPPLPPLPVASGASSSLALLLPTSLKEKLQRLTPAIPLAGRGGGGETRTVLSSTPTPEQMLPTPRWKEATPPTTSSIPSPRSSGTESLAPRASSLPTGGHSFGSTMHGRECMEDDHAERCPHTNPPFPFPHSPRSCPSCEKRKRRSAQENASSSSTYVCPHCHPPYVALHPCSCTSSHFSPRTVTVGTQTEVKQMEKEKQRKRHSHEVGHEKGDSSSSGPSSVSRHSNLNAVAHLACQREEKKQRVEKQRAPPRRRRGKIDKSETSARPAASPCSSSASTIVSSTVSFSQPLRDLPGPDATGVPTDQEKTSNNASSLTSTSTLPSIPSKACRSSSRSSFVVLGRHRRPVLSHCQRRRSSCSAGMNKSRAPPPPDSMTHRRGVASGSPPVSSIPTTITTRKDSRSPTAVALHTSDLPLPHQHHRPLQREARKRNVKRRKHIKKDTTPPCVTASSACTAAVNSSPPSSIPSVDTSCVPTRSESTTTPSLLWWPVDPGSIWYGPAPSIPPPLPTPKAFPVPTIFPPTSSPEGSSEENTTASSPVPWYGGPMQGGWPTSFSPSVTWVPCMPPPWSRGPGSPPPPSPPLPSTSEAKEGGGLPSVPFPHHTRPGPLLGQPSIREPSLEVWPGGALEVEGVLESQVRKMVPLFITMSTPHTRDSSMEEGSSWDLEHASEDALKAYGTRVLQAYMKLKRFAKAEDEELEAVTAEWQHWEKRNNATHAMDGTMRKNSKDHPSSPTIISPPLELLQKRLWWLQQRKLRRQQLRARLQQIVVALEARKGMPHGSVAKGGGDKDGVLNFSAMSETKTDLSWM